MAKTRAEIQKAYRERKKIQDPSYSEHERMRQNKYRVPIVSQTKRMKKKIRQRNKQYSKKYREKTKAAHELSNEAENTSNYSIQVNDITSSSTPSTSLSQGDSVMRPTRQNSNHTYFMRLDFNGNRKECIKSKRKRSKCLTRAHKKIQRLQQLLKTANKSKKMLQKRAERFKGKYRKLESSFNSASTPKSKAMQELRDAGISPRRLPSKVVKKLIMANVEFEEVRASKNENKQQKQQAIIHRVVSGRIVKKYRMKRALQTACCLARRGITKADSKEITHHN